MKVKNYDPNELPNEYSQELKQIIGSMLNKDPKMRPSCEHILGNKHIVLYISRKLAKLSKSKL